MNSKSTFNTICIHYEYLKYESLRD